VGEIFKPTRYNVKQKLTLGLSKEVIDKAKAAHINISAVTEQVLRAFTYEPEGYTQDDIANAYAELFKSMQPVLKKYGATVTVGENANQPNEPPYDIFLDNGELFIDDGMGYEPGEMPISVSISEALPYLYNPAQILEEMIKSLIRAAERNKEKLQAFKFASRFLRLLSEEDESTTLENNLNKVNG
jgi:Post-segregation antitoxin CcdA